MKQYYRTDKIESLKAQYNILLGERSCGKSYAVKEKVLMKAWHEKSYFVLIRRYRDDITRTNVLNYFADMPIMSITDGEYMGIDFYRNQLFFCKYDDDGKIHRGQFIGHVVSLNNDERIKSQAFPNVTDIIYEEFITKNLYLTDEPTRLMNVISTIARDETVTVWLVGNKINQVCPYVYEWDLKNIPTQKAGTIDTYSFPRFDKDGNKFETLIAVENCDNFGSNSKMFFGKAAESIVGSAWECDVCALLPERKDVYECVYELIFESMGFGYIMQLLVDVENGGMFIYTYPASRTRITRNIRRKITETFSTDPFVSSRLNDRIPAEVKMKQLLRDNKICFATYLCGQNFKQVMKQRKGVL